MNRLEFMYALAAEDPAELDRYMHEKVDEQGHAVEQGATFDATFTIHGTLGEIVEVFCKN